MSKKTLALGRVYLAARKIWRNSACPLLSLLAHADPARLRPLLRSKRTVLASSMPPVTNLIAYISEDSQPALWVLINIYRGLLEKIAVKQYDVFSAKVSTEHVGEAAHPWERFPEALLYMMHRHDSPVSGRRDFASVRNCSITFPM